MKLSVFFLFILFLMGCNSSTEHVVSLDELSKPSNRYLQEDASNYSRDTTKLGYDSISYFSKKIVDTLGISKSHVHRISTFLFPDRFNPVKSDKWYGISANDSFVYKHWMYADTNVAENTYFNWLDNFGDQHLSLKIGDKVHVSSNAFVLLLQHRSVLCIEQKKQLTKDQLLRMLDTLGFGSTWKYVLYQNVGKKTEWFENLNLTTKK